MGTQVLNPRYCLVDHLRVTTGNSHPWPRSAQKPAIKKKPVNKKQEPGKTLVMGKVTILRRDQPLDIKKDERFTNQASVKTDFFDEDLIVSGTDRLGPDPALVPKQIRLADPKAVIVSPVFGSDVYAGSAFAFSPSPSSLPLPKFSPKKASVAAIVDDSATRDLRRLLRID